MIEVKTPCLLTALAELAEPRYMHAGLIIDAYEKEIKVEMSSDKSRKHTSLRDLELVKETFQLLLEGGAYCDCRRCLVQHRV